PLGNYYSGVAKSTQDFEGHTWPLSPQSTSSSESVMADVIEFSVLPKAKMLGLPSLQW
ncbi:hypothetical protein CEXT_705871, partial [Caerostris extrusa]